MADREPLVIVQGLVQQLQSGDVLRDVVYAAAGFGAAGFLIESDSAARDVRATTISSANIVTASSPFGTDNSVLRSDGTGRGAQSSGASVDDSGVLTASRVEVTSSSGRQITYNGENIPLPNNGLIVAGGSGVAGTTLQIARVTNAGSPVSFRFLRGRGNDPSSPEDLVDQDNLGFFSFQGWSDGLGGFEAAPNLSAVEFKAETAGPSGTQGVSGKYIIKTKTSGDDQLNHDSFVVDNRGNAIITQDKDIEPDSMAESNVFIVNGVAPSSGAADGVHLYAQDFAAGDSRLHIDSESGDGLILGNGSVDSAGALHLNPSANDGVVLPSFTDATRPTAGVAGRMIWNTDDSLPNFDDGTQWVDALGNPT